MPHGIDRLPRDDHGHNGRLARTRGQLQRQAHFGADRSIDRIGSDEIEDFLDSKKAAFRRRNNLRSEIITLFRYAQIRLRALHRDRKTETEPVLRDQTKRKPVETFSPSEFQTFLGIVRPEWLAWLALGGLAGIRTDGEIFRITWERAQAMSRMLEKADPLKMSVLSIFALRRALSGFFIFTGAFFASVPILPHIGLALGGFPTFAIAAKFAELGYFATALGFCFRIARLVQNWLYTLAKSPSNRWYFAVFPVLGKALNYNLILFAFSAAIYILELPAPFKEPDIQS
jgi:hypothetical protein